jgi:hypothetical protein
LTDSWALEVVKGREVGRVFPVEPGSCTLGNRLNGDAGIDLAEQEGTSPRRMAARQALLDCSADRLTLRDLDSPGGTFVNRQRLLPDQVRALDVGDVIQVGSVQLRVARSGSSTRPAARPAPVSASASAPSRASTGLPTPYVLKSGPTCRSWDDFLTISAQSWPALRDEIESGRLDAFLRSIGRADLAPPSAGGKPPDERLDEWLGRLPTLRPTGPELEVHPAVVRVRGVGGGGQTRARVVLTNTGYRLLRSTLRIEPAGTSWLRFTGDVSSRVTTVDSTEVSLTVEIPETLDSPRACTLVIDSNGGSRRVEIRLEPPPRVDGLPPAGESMPASVNWGITDWLAGLTLGRRLLRAVGVACGVRVVVAVGDWLATVLGIAGTERPALSGVALLGALIFGVIGGRFAASRGSASDLIPGTFTGAVVGVLLAAVAVATSRSLEFFTGGSLVPGLVIWAGAAA